jgi:hypothetical protein
METVVEITVKLVDLMEVHPMQVMYLEVLDHHKEDLQEVLQELEVQVAEEEVLNMAMNQSQD